MIFLFLISSAVSRKGTDDCSSHSHPEAPAGLLWDIVNLMFSWILLMSSRNPCSLSRDPVKTKKEVLKESLHHSLIENTPSPCKAAASRMSWSMVAIKMSA